MYTVVKYMKNRTYCNVVTGTRIVLHAADVGSHIQTKCTSLLPCTPHLHLEHFNISFLSQNSTRVVARLPESVILDKENDKIV
jgi:hypothetical protein